MAKAKRTYDRKEFITSWNGSDSPEVVAKKFAMSKDEASAIASQMRKKDIFMKKMAKGPGSSIDWKGLASFSLKFKKQAEKAAEAVH